MKRFIFFVLVIGTAAGLFAQQLPEHRFVSGTWNQQGDRYFQNDAKARLAKVNIRVPQSGPMLYDFNARYEDGADDGQGGFGIHLFADSVFNGPSWGCGKSYLLWLNYDEKPLKNSGIQPGLTGQVYRSLSNTKMELLYSVDLNQYAEYLTPENLSEAVPFKIWVNGDTGEVRVYDPTDPYLSTYFYFNIDKKDLPLKGNWVALRTNGLKISFAPEWGDTETPAAPKGAGAVITPAGAGSLAADSSSADNSSADSKTNWDALLNDYEQYINDAIAIYKKAMAGDMSALSQYTSITQQAEALSQKLQASTDELTSAQMTHLTQIVAKATSDLAQ